MIDKFIDFINNAHTAFQAVELSVQELRENGYQELEEKPIQKTFDDSLADGIVKIAELFNKDRRSQMVNKMKSFIEDHKVTPEDEE